MIKGKVDKYFLIITLTLAIAGLFVFGSASLGVLATNHLKFTTVAINQFLLGFCMGLLGLFLASRVDYKKWRSLSPIIFIVAVVLTLLVFAPMIGIEYNGANRWIGAFGFSFQPGELLKIAYVFLLAAIFAKHKDKVKEVRYGLLPFLAVTGVVGAIFFLQPDNDTFLMTFAAGLCIYLVAGGKWQHIILLVVMCVMALGAVFYFRPYVKDRILTFINPAADPLSSGWQIQQSLIAIGSGGFLGKGFGQSTQKFGFLPEPIGDSIFAVASEEFGFLGSVSIVVLFLFFILRGLKIASGTEDTFGRLIVVGIVILIGSGSFINIASMLGLMPLSGTPLVFISHGGTALFLALCQTGVIINVSRKKR